MSDSPATDPQAHGITDQKPLSPPKGQKAVVPSQLPQEGLPASGTHSSAAIGIVLDVGGEFGPYKILDKLGEGGMGAVYKARHTKLDRLVALKVLPPRVMSRPDALSRFEREIKAVGKLSHPNVVQAHDAGEFGGVHYLSMEYVEGQDLHALVKAKGPMTIVNACKAVRQAALGLAAAHKLGLVHRDIKPSNLFVTKETGQIKILDMGLALLAQDDVLATLTSSGECFGTPDYMAPEQWEDAHACDARADLYALGCTLFLLLVGRAPYGGTEYRTTPRKMMGHVHDAIPDLMAERSDIPGELNAIYRKLMAKKPDDRFASADELAKALVPFTSPIGAIATPADIQTPFETQLHSDSDTMIQRSYVGVTEMIESEKAVAGNGAGGGTPGPKTPWKTGSQDASASKDGPVNSHGSSGVRLLASGGVAALALLAVFTFVNSKKDDATTKIEKRTERPIVEKTEPSTNELPVPVTTLPVETSSSSPGWQGWSADAPAHAVAPFDAELAKKHQEFWAAYLHVPVEYTNSIGMRFRLIPPGEFEMGSTQSEIDELIAGAGDDENAKEHYCSEFPKHRVILTQPIYFGVFEVTQKQYQQVVGMNPSSFAATGGKKEEVVGMDTANHPVEIVNWFDAADFCVLLSDLEKLKPFYVRDGDTVNIVEGAGYRLPKESEWKFASSAGITTNYSSGDSGEGMVDVAWFNGNSGNRTHSVGELKGNSFGLFDVYGNVWEWSQDWWDKNYYEQFRQKAAVDPNGPSMADFQRMCPGGGFNGYAFTCRTWERNSTNPGQRQDNIGFRVILTVDAVREKLKGPAVPAVQSSE